MNQQIPEEWHQPAINVVSYTTPNHIMYLERWVAGVMAVSAKDSRPYQLHVRSAKHMGKQATPTESQEYQGKNDALYTSIIADRTAFYSATVNELPTGSTVVIMDMDVVMFRPLSELLRTCESTVSSNEATVMCMRNMPLEKDETDSCDGDVRKLRKCNAGFLVLTVTEATRAVVSAWHTNIMERKQTRDQPTFNKVLRTKPHSSAIRVIEFPATVAAFQVSSVGAETIMYGTTLLG